MEKESNLARLKFHTMRDIHNQLSKTPKIVYEKKAEKNVIRNVT